LISYRANTDYRDYRDYRDDWSLLKC